MRGQALFDKVVELCGVSAVLAPGLVRRALLDGKVSVEDATAGDYRKALPRLLARLRAYMPEDEAQRRARRIAGLLQALESGRSIEGEDEDDWSLVGRVSDILRAGTPAEGSGRTPSGEVSLPAADEDEPTLIGRRYTADERQILSKTGVLTRDGRPGSKEIDLSGTDAGPSDLRKTRR